MKRWTKCCAPEGTAVALGMFDGLHLGHRSVLQTLKKKAKERSLPTLILLLFPIYLLRILAEKAG